LNRLNRLFVRLDHQQKVELLEGLREFLNIVKADLAQQAPAENADEHASACRGRLQHLTQAIGIAVSDLHRHPDRAMAGLWSQIEAYEQGVVDRLNE